MSIASLAGVVDELSSILSGLDADSLSAGEAAAAVSVFVRGENLCATGKALCADRAARAGEHRRSGHIDPASWLAERSGETRGRARDALDTAAALSRLGELDGAVRSGELSPTKARVVAEAASMDPASESKLLEVAREGSLSELRDGAEAVKAAARSELEDTRRYEEIRKGRHLRTFTGRDGGFKGQLSLTPDAGAKVLAVLQPASDFFFEEARREGRREHNEAYLADALVAVITGEWLGNGEADGDDGDHGADGDDGDHGDDGADGDGADGAGADGEDQADGGQLTPDSGAGKQHRGRLGGRQLESDGAPAITGAAWGTDCQGLPERRATGDSAEHDSAPELPASAAGNLQVVAGGCPSPSGVPPTSKEPARQPRRRRRDRPQPPGATVICRVDLAALRRGRLLPGESCEIPGVGAVPLAAARELFGDCFLKFVISDGIDVRTVGHYGRSIPAHLKTALQFRDRRCVVPGCGRTFGLEYDHIVEFAKGGPTTLENLCRLCAPHHAMKTHKSYRISGGPGHWRWTAPREGGWEEGGEEGRDRQT
ncbi:MAG: HNH endonuclease signature motif containing protein [Acidimicrobiales bacterium]